MAFIKKYWIVISLSCLALAALLNYALPAPGKNFEARLDSILPKDRKNFDFTKTVIELSALADPRTDTAWTENEIESMAATLRKIIGDEANPQKVIDAFNGYFFDSQGFVFDRNFTAMSEAGGEVPVDDLRNFHSIEKTLRRKQGICLSISLIYLMLGDKLNLPLYGVLIPGHIYVRYKEPGRAGINIETTVSGAEFYGYKDEIYRLDSSKTVYGKEIDKYAVIGAYLSNLGGFFMSIGDYKRAETLFLKSSEMLPGSAEGIINLGILDEMTDKPLEAEKCYLNTLQILPENGYAHYRLGAMYLKQKRYLKAEIHLEEAVRLKAGGKDAAELLEKARKKGGG
jgi:hypothetical protein